MIGKFKNVLCIYPYYYRNPYQVFPPLALEYIAGAVESLVDKVTVIDMRFERDITPYVKDADLVFTFGHYEDCAILCYCTGIASGNTHVPSISSFRG